MTRFERPLGRWLNPGLGGLGAVVLTSYLMIGHPDVGVAATPDWTAVAQVRLAASVPTPLTADNERAVIPKSTVAQGELTRPSMIGVLHAGLGTMLAAAWLMGGAWVGIRSARISPSSMKPQTTRASRTDYDSPRAPTYND
jgi:hypothetical protein